MNNLYILAAVFLFWSALAASLMQVQLATPSMHKLRVPTYRSMPIRATVIAQVSTITPAASYN